MATEITKAVQWLEDNIPALKALAAEVEKLGNLRAEEQNIRNEIRSLDATRTQMGGDIETLRGSAAAAESKAAASRVAAEKVATARLEDLQRQQKVYEDQLTLLRVALEKAGNMRTLKEQEHEAAVKEIEKRGMKAAAELLETQAKIKALHQHLAGAPA